MMNLQDTLTEHTEDHRRWEADGLHTKQCSKCVLIAEIGKTKTQNNKLRKALREILHNHYPPGYKCRITEICAEALV